MLSEELLQTKEKMLRALKLHPNMDIDKKIEMLRALRVIFKKDEDINHRLWANFELRALLHKKLSSELQPSEQKKLLKEYWDTFLIGAPYSFHDYMLYLEHNRDKEKRFYENRMKQLRPIVQDLQDLYDKKIMRLGISLPPGTGKSTLIIFYLTWVMGKDPLMPNLYSGYADKLCRGAFDGVLSILKDPEYCFNEIFPDSPIATTNAKDESIDLVKQQRFKTFTARSLDAGLTGATRCENILVLDDPCSGIEEAMNADRLDSLWMKVTNDLFSRAKEGCRILMIATRWSCNDPLGRMESRYADDPKSKFVRTPALDSNGESNFEYKCGVGFSKAYFENMRSNMDDISWRAIYQQEPIEREGLLYPKDSLHKYFGDLPEGKPEAIVAICDSKNQGKDYVCSLCGYIYGDSVFIKDVVFNNGLPEVTKPLVAGMCVRNKVSRIDIESNNGGEYYAQDVSNQIKEQKGYTSVRTFFTSTNKITKIVTESDYIKKHFVFLDDSVLVGSEYAEYRAFMKNVYSFTIAGKSKHDDGPDGLAMLSQLVKDLSGMQVQILDRRKLPF